MSGAYAVIPDAPYSVEVTLVSGDLPLGVTDASVVAQIYGSVTPSAGTASIAANNCVGPIEPGSTCTVTVSYDPATIACTGSPYGYGYTGIDLALVSDARFNIDFTQRFNVTGIPICDS